MFVYLLACLIFIHFVQLDVLCILQIAVQVLKDSYTTETFKQRQILFNKHMMFKRKSC